MIYLNRRIHLSMVFATHCRPHAFSFTSTDRKLADADVRNWATFVDGSVNIDGDSKLLYAAVKDPRG